MSDLRAPSYRRANAAQGSVRFGSNLNIHERRETILIVLAQPARRDNYFETLSKGNPSE
ncbi:hypothetical protein PM082_021142 [Marasmius tenuissimus]|nr:hypothetical protein PM082_021142 [Marasmius tenuissimus]